jgi:hypothetical protein
MLFRLEINFKIYHVLKYLQAMISYFIIVVAPIKLVRIKRLLINFWVVYLFRLYPL